MSQKDKESSIATNTNITINNNNNNNNNIINNDKSDTPFTKAANNANKRARTQIEIAAEDSE